MPGGAWMAEAGRRDDRELYSGAANPEALLTRFAETLAKDIRSSSGASRTPPPDISAVR